MKRALVFVSMLALACSLAPVSAATPPPVPVGLAWDSVAKLIQTSDVSSLQPGTFDADFQTASQPVQSTQPRGGFLSKISTVMQQASSMASMLKNGTAESHYIAGLKERVDSPATQKATILDCGARTLTTLDLKAKTYTVVSLDAPVTRSVGTAGATRSAPAAMPTDDGTRMSFTLVNKALGQRTIAPDSTDGFSSDMTIVVTRANGQSNASNTSLLEYLSRYPRLSLVCKGPAGAAQPGVAGMGMAQRQMIDSALYGGDSRIKMSSSGPALPANRLPLWEVTTFGSQPGQRGGFVMLSERGNVRSVRADDSIFSVPADFTLVSS
jgi:hypothetical protein